MTDSPPKGNYFLHQTWLIAGLCVFIACVNFKPSDPYLTQYLLCDKDTQIDYCSDFHDITTCSSNTPCFWSADTSLCTVQSCNDVSLTLCGNDDYDYCKKSDDSTQCSDARCYKNFSEDQVNNDIYPWSTYFYLPFLVLLGPFAELYSYRMAILFGICGRVLTRFLLLYGDSLVSTQLMQVKQQTSVYRCPHCFILVDLSVM